VKFCYIDESGKGNEPILVLAGIIADAHRMHVTKSDWLEILQALSRDVQRPIEEFHTRHFYKGNGIWRSLNGEQRTAVLNRILEWMAERNHKVVFAAVDKKKADSANLSGKGEFVRNAQPNYWKLGAFHLFPFGSEISPEQRKEKGTHCYGVRPRKQPRRNCGDCLKAAELDRFVLQLRARIT
jgi:hypothetical protein